MINPSEHYTEWGKAGSFYFKNWNSLFLFSIILEALEQLGKVKA